MEPAQICGLHPGCRDLRGGAARLPGLPRETGVGDCNRLGKSIAVLPFENRSEDKANAYFADGIQDEILTRLGRIGQLKVISRTSTEKYRSRPDNLRIVAEELGVTALLEGSVQKSGSKVRVIVQLIEASSDRHLWAETYDRSLDDVFTVQSEIAENVASALRANLTPQESVAVKRVPTSTQKAYDLFLRAEHFVRLGEKNLSAASVLQAIELYRQAIAEDAHFALAYARLSYASSFARWLAAPAMGPPEQERRDAEKALALQPDLTEAHLALAYCDYWGRLDYASALNHLAQAQASAPQSVEVLRALGAVYRRQLRFDNAIAVYERAAEYDPQNSDLFADLAVTYAWAGRAEKVQPTFERALALDPNNEGAALRWALFLMGNRGDFDGARKVLRSGGPRLQRELAWTYRLTRDFEEAIRLVAELPADSVAFGPPDPAKDELLGICLHYAGHDEQARPLAEAARDRLKALLADKELSPRQIPFISMRLARIELALSNKPGAVEVAERGLQSDVATRDPIIRLDYRGDLAAIYAQAGRTDAAIALISELLKSSSVAGQITPIMLRINPDFDSLREDARFQALLKEPSAAGEKKVVKP